MNRVLGLMVSNYSGKLYSEQGKTSENTKGVQTPREGLWDSPIQLPPFTDEEPEIPDIPTM